MDYKFTGTQGLWKATNGKSPVNIVVSEATYVVENEVQCVAVIGDQENDNGVEANAALIAASPQLLDACIEAIHLGVLPASVAIKMDAAIRKALNIPHDAASF